MVQMVLNMSLLMSQHVFCWTQWGSDRLPSSSCARFRVLYEDCSKTLRKETFFKPPGAHHQTNSMEFHPPNAPNILWVEILRKSGGPKHVPRFSPSTVDQFSVESGPCQLTTVIPSEWPLKGIVFWSICRWFRQKCPFTVPSQSLTWNLKMMVSTWNLLFHGLIFRFHV